jgi:formylglycine-generating enzyme required for sulfatase activity
MKRFSLVLGLLLGLQTVVSAQQDTLPAPASYRVNGVSFKMVRIEKGDYWMGAQHSDTAEFNYDRYSQTDELPVHHVVIHEDYYIGQTEVTQQLWKAVMGSNPSKKKCPKRPVESVSYYDIQEFLVILDSLTGMHFRLPTEEEWEYAARGGKHSRGYVYSGGKEAERVAWFNDNTNKLKKVKKRKPNELGIYDMSGNVWEWTDTKYRFYDKERNARLGKEGQMYVIRGGAWQLPKTSCRIAWRGKRLPDLKNSFGGFRLCLDAKYVKEAEEKAPEILMKEKKNES